MKLFYQLLTFACIYSFAVNAKTLTYVVGLSKPPYVIQHSNTGYELETVSAITKLMGYNSNYLYVPFGRSPSMMKVKEVDGILTVNKQIIDKKEHLTTPYITYQNVVVTKKSDKLNISNISDLSHVSFAAFQNSVKLLGDEYGKAAKRSPYFTEVTEQYRQIELLNEKRVQALVIDINIFNYYASQAERYQPNDYSIHPVFSPSQYSLAFKNKSNVLLFNQALKTFKNSQEYQAIKDKYNLRAVPASDLQSN